MKVLKFGGTSVGTPESITNVKHIVKAQTGPLVVVVSALGGVTDMLIAAARDAAAGNDCYRTALESLSHRHRTMTDTVIAPDKQPQVHAALDRMLGELGSILHGVYLIQDLTPKTADAVVSYGERLSSVIAATLIDGAHHTEARSLIFTTGQGAGRTVDFNATNTAIAAILGHYQEKAGNADGDIARITVMGGFIASDSETGQITNLGRGGSDYTAAIVAAALDAEALEIWTDVDGFMTADPRIIPAAYPIEALTYDEAMELCNFGAKVIYPPTIFPVCVKNIPIYVKNTFNPGAKGSVICKNVPAANRPIRGLSSVDGTSMVTVSGLSMVGVVGVNRRIFNTLAEGGISVFMVAQTSSETSTSMCMTHEDAPRACRLLDREFAAEIAAGSMNRTSLLEGLATVAAVGRAMKHTPGTAGKLLGVLGRNGISVCATAIGALEMNLSFVVRREQLRKSLGVLHDSFFLSPYEEINLFVCGTGTVGSSLLGQIATQRESLMRERRLKINLVGICGRSRAVYDENGIDPAAWREALREDRGGIGRMTREAIERNLYNSVLADCTASDEAADCYEALLGHNVSVVAANKSAASADYAVYRRLKQTARERGVRFLFETNVGAGLPIISTIGDLRASGDKILRIEAVLSGTLNYVFNTLSADTPLSRAIRLAQENGYSEPDPRVDLSGKDVARKITILARESGYAPELSDITVERFIPQAFFDMSETEFWAALPSLDNTFETERQRLEATHKRRRFVATWSDGKGHVGLREIPEGHPFYDLEGSNNILLLTTERYREYPMLIQGYGAGADVTAAGVFADILRARS